ncbi:hypothetical protein GCK72_002642 [Caenorhabditis remanei]|uniref:Uncharacterized protein n=1 Tax=Caenorhabditis remanei TaxID=31234 RepID=A0A6A5HSC2_CAERE|nr:hypothetical protein GCK72_002642 [Caenorhabditis remanei]KAF1770818.1 hypothetical protein GCK72_002642 [Caenorhabditis remanei]
MMSFIRRFARADDPTGRSVTLGAEDIALCPVNISNINTPSDQKSAAMECPLRLITSGAMYSTVPQKLYVFFSLSIASLLNPKPLFKCHILNFCDSIAVASHANINTHAFLIPLTFPFDVRNPLFDDGWMTWMLLWKVFVASLEQSDGSDLMDT